MTSLSARALTLFDEYVAMPAPERARALETLARCDAPLHAILRSLLDADAQDDDFLQRSAVDFLAGRQSANSTEAPDDDSRCADQSRVGERLGPWRLQRLIARGGMGAVYEAHRDDGHYQQRVALKCIRNELVSPELVAAFLDERHHLARLDHAGIASLVDGGIDGEGRPWFAMRYVDGMPVDQWCDARKADVRTRVGLLIQACEAFAHAHAQGVLHGDIKPGNLLVTPDGHLHVVDFGISSILTAAASPQRQLAATLDYSAPELLRYGSRGPAVDIYSLGVLAYRLLCAHWPTPRHGLHELMPSWSAAAAEPMERLLRTCADPASLAQQRGARSAAALADQLAGDLSAIALKAVADAPQDRYASAAEFGADLQRWREDRPVLARPLGRLARLGKLMRRNRAATALAASLLLVLAAGTAITAWQSQRAAREARATLAVVQLFASTLGTATLSGLGSAPFSSSALLNKTEAQLRQMSLGEHPELLAHSLATLARGNAVIGDYKHAESLAAEAMRALGDSGDEDGYVSATQVSMLNARTDFDEATRLATIRLSELADRADASARQEKINFSAELAQAQWGQARPSAALRTLDEALAQARALGPGHEELQAQVLIRRGSYLSRMSRFKEAHADLLSAIALARPHNTVLADDGREEELFMLLCKSQRVAPALAERLLASRRSTLGERHPKTGRAWILLGFTQYYSGSKVVARQKLRAGLDMIEAAYGREHPEYAQALMFLAYTAPGDSRDSVNELREVLRICVTTMGPRHEITMRARNALSIRLMNLPPRAQQAGDAASLLALATQNLEFKREAGLPTARETHILARALMLNGSRSDLPRAAALLDQTRADIDRYHAPDDLFSKLVAQTRTSLGYLLGRRAEADADFARLLAADRDDSSDLAGAGEHESFLYRALYAYETCRDRDAYALLERANALDLRRQGPDAYSTQESRAYLVALRNRSMLQARRAQAIPQYELDATAARRMQNCGQTTYSERSYSTQNLSAAIGRDDPQPGSGGAKR
ncbi:serine/threonine-protein kinase [Lysobacter sp. CCNWLW3]|uniref:serine/threonine-protein kinase n=1 Tax=unclassified Lysobacter TaxID=2635362 RepID=UPI002FD0EBA0